MTMSSGRSQSLTRALLAFAVAAGLLAMHHLVVHGGAMHAGSTSAGSFHVTALHQGVPSSTATSQDVAEPVLATPLGGHMMLHDCPATLAAALLLTISLFALGILDDRRLALRAVLTRLRRIGRGPPPTPTTSRRLSALSILRV